MINNNSVIVRILGNSEVYWISDVICIQNYK